MGHYMDSLVVREKTCSEVVVLVKLTRTRKEVAPIQASKDVWVCEDICSSCHRRVALASPQISTGRLDGGEAGGACRVDAETRPREPKEVAVGEFFFCQQTVAIVFLVNLYSVVLCGGRREKGEEKELGLPT